MTDTLSKQDQTKVHAASSEGVASICSGLAPTHRKKRLIGPRNIYAANPNRFLEEKQKAGSPLAKPASAKQLVEYVVASGPLHCADGWSYLGRSLAALVAGDRRGALHLAYYAELRAALSLLANQGIAVLNRRHFVILADGAVQCLASGMGTHRFVWTVLETWSNGDKASSVLGSVLRPLGVPVATWLNGSVASWSTWKPVASQWLETIGLDLRLLAEDREARNLGSYGVGDFSAEEEPSIQDRLDFVVSLWELLEPDPTVRFRYLDQHLLRTTLRTAHSASYAAAPSISLEDYVNDALQNAMGEASHTALRAFLSESTVQRNHPVLEAASARVDLSDARRHFHAAARAAILLRISSGVWLDLFREVGVEAGSLAFHWAPYGRARGLWDPQLSLSSCNELWDQVGESLDDVLDWMSQTPDDGKTAFSAERDLARSIRVLSSLEVVGLWSLA